MCRDHVAEFYEKPSLSTTTHDKQIKGRAYRRMKTAMKQKQRILVAKTYGCFWTLWTDKQDRYLKRPKNSHVKTYFKRYSNHKFRKMKTGPFEHSTHKRQFDYMWTIT